MSDDNSAPKGDIAKGYANPKPRSKDIRLLVSRAQAYKPNPALDRLATLKGEKPEEYARVAPNLKTALGYYLDQKAAYDQAVKEGLLG